MAPARRALEELECAVGLRSAAPGRTPVCVPEAQIRLGDPTLSAADADERSAARGAARLILSRFCIHDRVPPGMADSGEPMPSKPEAQDRFRPFAGPVVGVATRVFGGTRLPIARGRVSRRRGAASIRFGDRRGEAWTNFPSRRFMVTPHQGCKLDVATRVPRESSFWGSTFAVGRPSKRRLR